MATPTVIEEGIRIEADGLLSFGDFLVKDKKKVNDFEAFGDVYKVKTHKELTRLEKNGRLLFESVPGSAVFGLSISEESASFSIDGFEDTKIIMELEPDTQYAISIDEQSVGDAKSNLSGKINFSIDLTVGKQAVKIEKK